MALYDDYLYDTFPVTDTRPDHLATLAALFKLRATSPARCRYLELGCGLGGNVIPLGVQYPESTFVGVDQSSRQIEEGNTDVRALGLKNVELKALDILDVDESIGMFDFIVCHGVYSWVPPEVQAKILKICAEQLNPNGVVYISYNTLPGWHMRGMIRDMLRHEVDASGTARERVARARQFMGLLEYVPQGSTYSQSWLRGEAQLLTRLSDKYLFYEHLVEQNQPKYFREFAAEADQAGLRYLGDAHFYSMVPGRFGSEAAERIASMSSNIIDTEQYMDFLDTRFFRRTLLCRKDAELDRDVSWKRVTNMWVSAWLSSVSDAPDLVSDAPEDFQKPGGARVSSTMPLLKSALSLLAQHTPRGLHFVDLCAQARAMVDGCDVVAPTEADCETLGSNLLGLYAQGHVDFGMLEPAYVLSPGQYPATTAIARLQARRGRTECTSARHESVSVDAFDRALLAQMDGTNDWEALVTGVMAEIESGALSVEVSGSPVGSREMLLEITQQKLVRLAKIGLLIK